MAAYDYLLSMPIVNTNQEATFEAIRAALPPDNGAFMSKQCLGGTAGQCILDWRPDALKAMIVATDEDSDLPTLSRYRMPGHNVLNNSICAGWLTAVGNCPSNANVYEPGWSPKVVIGAQLYYSSGDTKFYYTWYRTGRPMTLTDPYEAELNLTANMLIQNRVYLSLIAHAGGSGGYHYNHWWWKQMNPAAAATATPWLFAPWDATYTLSRQYGHVGYNVQNNRDLSGFNINATLANHRTHNLTGSLQARLLASGIVMRIFNIGYMNNASDPVHQKYVSDVYTQVVNNTASLAKFCTLTDAPLDAENFVIVNDATTEIVILPEDINPTETDAKPQVEDPPPAESDVKINDFVNNIKDTVQNIYNEIVKDDRNVAGFISGVTFAVIGGVVLMIVSYRNRERAFEIFRGKVLDSEAVVHMNPLDKSREQHNNPLYAGRDTQGAETTALNSSAALPALAV